MDVNFLKLQPHHYQTILHWTKMNKKMDDTSKGSSLKPSLNREEEKVKAEKLSQITTSSLPNDPTLNKMTPSLNGEEEKVKAEKLSQITTSSVQDDPTLINTMYNLIVYLPAPNWWTTWYNVAHTLAVLLRSDSESTWPTSWGTENEVETAWWSAVPAERECTPHCLEGQTPGFCAVYQQQRRYGCHWKSPKLKPSAIHHYKAD